MAEPSTAAVATLVVTGAALPILTAFGIPLGLRVDVLLAGFFGSVAAMGLLNTVPSTEDTLKELVRTTWRRLWVALASTVTAGYLTPLAVVIPGIEQAGLLSIAFGIGAGAQQVLAAVVRRLAKKIEGEP